jgi:hypothetical protein
MDEVTKVALGADGPCKAAINDRLLDECINSLENQNCDPNMGPVVAMPGCNSYCASAK